MPQLVNAAAFLRALHSLRATADHARTSVALPCLCIYRSDAGLSMTSTDGKVLCRWVIPYLTAPADTDHPVDVSDLPHGVEPPPDALLIPADNIDIKKLLPKDETRDAWKKTGLASVTITKTESPAAVARAIVLSGPTISYHIPAISFARTPSGVLGPQYPLFSRILDAPLSHPVIQVPSEPVVELPAPCRRAFNADYLAALVEAFDLSKVNRGIMFDMQGPGRGAIVRPLHPGPAAKVGLIMPITLPT